MGCLGSLFGMIFGIIGGVFGLVFGVLGGVLGTIGVVIGVIIPVFVLALPVLVGVGILWVLIRVLRGPGSYSRVTYRPTGRKNETEPTSESQYAENHVTDVEEWEDI